MKKNILHHIPYRFSVFLGLALITLFIGIGWLGEIIHLDFWHWAGIIIVEFILVYCSDKFFRFLTQ